MYSGSVLKHVGCRAGLCRVRNKSPGGFMLIEQLLVMAVLSPSLQRVREQTRAILCQTNLKRWGTMMTRYTVDFEGLFPMDWIPFL